MTTQQIALMWHDPCHNRVQRIIKSLPLTIGRKHPDNTVNLLLNVVSSQHAKLFYSHGSIVVADLGSKNGTRVHGRTITHPTPLINDGRFNVGPVEFYAALVPAEIADSVAPPARTAPPTQKSAETVLAFDPVSDLLRPPSAIAQQHQPFRYLEFDQPIVPTAQLPSDTEETTFLAIGGGLGSFSWVNHLLVYGADPREIVSIGTEQMPYGRYKRLCENSQIPAHERLRSNSDSCPDNLWGWPGYAPREMWQLMRQGNFSDAVKIGWQLFNEPLVETYTPKAGNVFKSIDREARRIGWDAIWRSGRVRAIRKTDDGRYVVAYSKMSRNKRSQHKLIVCRYLHLAVGYPGVRFLPDLEAYRRNTGDFERVVNAYENHEHVYKSLRETGGTVVMRGRGIVASRLLQRLHELREQTGMPIRVLHLMRSRNQSGNRSARARRSVKNHWELQPFNWPKAAWGGDLRAKLESASPAERADLLAHWGGTTTADRKDWQQIIANGLREGWYEIVFGEVDQVVRQADGRVLTRFCHLDDRARVSEISAEYIIDATGLESGIEANSLLKDLIDTYPIQRNPQNRFAVSNAFELDDMRNGAGRIYASGVATLGGPFAAVDSFLGLQCAAQRSVDDIAALPYTSIRPLSSMHSLRQWLRWARGATP